MLFSRENTIFYRKVWDFLFCFPRVLALPARKFSPHVQIPWFALHPTAVQNRLWHLPKRQAQHFKRTKLALITRKEFANKVNAWQWRRCQWHSENRADTLRLHFYKLHKYEQHPPLSLLAQDKYKTESVSLQKLLSVKSHTQGLIPSL